ncbi:MAG: MerR family transcriptional regulator [Endomicrobium sp.]|jgi:DNA-binding transcriptional MerR regulator|uniref:MerR family transcriptional regulator n=1 Tax=Candidatus Endomicrobiellum cubanum TaxID=3242325 RepID=UPI00282F529E|nr:MerR family transcriptional regulator [Endomicrobium sp.]MDR2395612.1 MerR family transcriptional regulator [Endomicrobium sp.]
MFQNKLVPEKEKFTISEVARLTLVPKHTLRYWEDEVKILRPIRNSNGKRIYCKEDIETVFKIKNLLYNERYTIEGVKKYFIRNKKNKNNENISQDHMPDSKFLQDIKNELNHILKLLRDI